MQRIAIVDDHTLFARGLQLLLNDLPGELCVDVYRDLATLVVAVVTAKVTAKVTGSATASLTTSLTSSLTTKDGQKGDYQLVILDYYLPKSSFVENVQSIKQQLPNCTLVVVSASTSLLDSQSALKHGASAFLQKDAEPEQLLDTIAGLLAGQVPEQQVIHGAANLADFELTERQIEILILISKGLSNKEVALNLAISPETVKSHLKEIFRRTQVENRVEAVDFARQYGLI